MCVQPLFSSHFCRHLYVANHKEKKNLTHIYQHHHCPRSPGNLDLLIEGPNVETVIYIICIILILTVSVLGALNKFYDYLNQQLLYH